MQSYSVAITITMTITMKITIKMTMRRSKIIFLFTFSLFGMFAIEFFMKVNSMISIVLHNNDYNNNNRIWCLLWLWLPRTRSQWIPQPTFFKVASVFSLHMNHYCWTKEFCHHVFLKPNHYFVGLFPHICAGGAYHSYFSSAGFCFTHFL